MCHPLDMTPIPVAPEIILASPLLRLFTKWTVAEKSTSKELGEKKPSITAAFLEVIKVFLSTKA